MNIFDNKQAYVGCAFLIIGLVLQFLTGNLVAWCIGSCLILFAPYGQYGNKKPQTPQKPYKTLKERQNDPNSHFQEKWCSISREQFETYARSVNECGESNSSFVKYFCGSRSLSRIIWAVLVFLAGISLANDGNYQVAAIAFDSYFVLKLIANLYNGADFTEGIKVPHNFSANAEGAESIFKTVYDEGVFKLQPQAFMRNDDGEISMRDFRFNIIPTQRIPQLLCSMVAMTSNEVHYLSYPYHYLVFVFKGIGLASDDDFQNAIGTIVDDRIERNKIDPHDLEALDEFDGDTHFSLDVKVDGGNSIFVVLKSKRSYESYTTNEKDCRILMNIASQTISYFESHREKIANVCGS